MVDENGNKGIFRIVEAESVLGTAKDKPQDVLTRKTDSENKHLAE
jgi:hypothetical protein